MSTPSPVTFTPLATEDAQRAAAEQRERYGRCENLLASADFRWFLAECVGPELDAVTATALDPAKESSQRDVAVHVRAALDRIHRWAEQERDIARDYIASLQT